MKVAVVGTRDIGDISLDFIISHIPQNTSEILSGGAEGIDALAKQAAATLGIKLTEFLPDYKTLGKMAPIARNCAIVKNSDLVIAFWDHKSKGTSFTLKQCIKLGVPFRIISI